MAAPETTPETRFSETSSVVSDWPPIKEKAPILCAKLPDTDIGVSATAAWVSLVKRTPEPGNFNWSPLDPAIVAEALASGAAPGCCRWPVEDGDATDATGLA
jgi:hypothetical protein